MFLEMKPGLWLSRYWIERITVIQVVEHKHEEGTFLVRIYFEAQGQQSQGQYLSLYQNTPSWSAAQTKAAFLVRELDRFVQGEEVVLVK